MRTDPELPGAMVAELKPPSMCPNTASCNGVIRRTMDTERNFGLFFPSTLAAATMRFTPPSIASACGGILLGMQHDDPSCSSSPVTNIPEWDDIHIPAYWSSIRSGHPLEAIARLHRTRVHGRQGAHSCEGLAQRRKDAEKLRNLTKRLSVSASRRKEA